MRSIDVPIPGDPRGSVDGVASVPGRKLHPSDDTTATRHGSVSQRPRGLQPLPGDKTSDPAETIGRSRLRRLPTIVFALPLAIVAVSAVLAAIPHRAAIPPLIESDYCYQLIAADRLLKGLGPTSLAPVAPNQPWEWHGDWLPLTQWPAGYPLLVVAVRFVAQTSTIEACRWISVVACAFALVGWFAWLRRATPPGLVGTALAAVAAGTAVSTANLINPSTDALLAAALPFVLLCITDRTWSATATKGAARFSTGHFENDSPSLLWLGMGGILAGGLFWLRYAAVFVPMGIVLALVVQATIAQPRRFRRPLVFSLAAAVPIVGLLLAHQLAADGGMQSQLNLGHAVGFDFSPKRLWLAWWRFTDLGFYSYLPVGHWIFALWPMALLALVVCSRSVRRRLTPLLQSHAYRLGGCLVVVLFAMLIGATVVFGGKFDYVDSLDRYYAPVRPMYFLLFVAPLALFSSRVIRVGACVGLVLAGSWLVQHEWPRPYNRWLSAQRVATTYGQWSRCFLPGADELYGWLREQANPNLIIFSNYHEYVAMETGLPAIPLPPDEPTRDRWVQRICRARGVDNPRVLFVLDDDNRWRDHWQSNPEDVKRQFRLVAHQGTPTSIARFVYVEG